MKLLIEVNNSKASLLLEFLRTLTYVKVKEVSPKEDGGKQNIRDQVKEAVEEMRDIKAGKHTGRKALDFLNEV